MNQSMRIYINKIENRIAFKIKAGYFLELLTPKTIKLLGSAIKSDLVKYYIFHLNILYF